ncbi:MAG: linear amide C-N hydrolase [Hyphomicrobiales bacterium]
MFRRIATITLATALALATTPGMACTGVSLKSNDGAAIRGRTLEFGFPLQSNVIVVPAGKEFTATMPDGSKGLTYTSRYNVVGANAFDATMIIDGLNDQGLSIGLFYFLATRNTPTRAKPTPRPRSRQDFGMGVPGNFATVDEVKKAVQDAIVGTPFPSVSAAPKAWSRTCTSSFRTSQAAPTA